MLNFCTLFNINYLAKGVALYQSLLKTCPQFHLYIFAFDDLSHKILTEQNLDHATIISLAEFEDEGLLAVKKTRSVAEYCWTCTPFTVKYCIEKYNLDHCTYVDADVYFHKNPSVLIDSMGNDSVLITPHNYFREYDQSAVSGIYCVQFVTFKNDENGRRVLDWWADACLKWCYARYEDGKMGDQKYLDCWPYVFDGVYICKDTRACAAPWNAINYNTAEIVNDIVFYHFHDLQRISDGTWFTGSYKLPKVVIDKIYNPYIELLETEDKKHPGVDTLYKKERKSFPMLTTKFKLGIYILELKATARACVKALFFVDRRRFYKDNFIK